MSVYPFRYFKYLKAIMTTKNTSVNE